MNVKIKIDTCSDNIKSQVLQLLQNKDINFINESEDADIIITDNWEKYASLTDINDNLQIIFFILDELPNVPQSNTRRFYQKGKICPKDFIYDIQCWISIFEILQDMYQSVDTITYKYEEVLTKYQEHKCFMKEATDWQLKSMRPEQSADFQYAYHYIPALFASGDFIYTKDFPTSSFFIIADVSGHGISDALIGTAFKNKIETFIDLKGEDASLEEVIQYLQNNKSCFYSKTEEQLPYSVHVLATKLDKTQHEMTICNVGYGDAPPIFVSGNNVEVYESVPEAVIPPIGEYDLKPVTTTVSFHPGNGLILCSDGYTEAFVSRNNQDKRYEYKPKRLAEAARRAVLHNINWTPQDMVEEINTDVKQYIQSSLSEKQKLSHDDMTLLVIKWLNKN